MDPLVTSTQIGPWTNEKHLDYLNSMEASFIRTMLENTSRHLRLDRYLPDRSESTLDLKSRRRKKQATSETVGPRSRMDGRSNRRTKKLSSQPPDSDPSQDQVVPQLENRRGDDAERDPPNVAAASLAPAN